MEFVNKTTIKLDRILNELDKLVLRFVKVLKKHTDYVIVNGYVAILLGRSRATEDVDIFVPEMSKDRFEAFYGDLKDNGFWCLNAEEADEVYSYLAEGLAVRFAEQDTTIPNFEVKFARKYKDAIALKDTLTVATAEGEIKISSLERQIAFKRYYLKSGKDLEDAEHLEKVFKEHLDMKKIELMRRLIEDEMAKAGKRQ